MGLSHGGWETPGAPLRRSRGAALPQSCCPLVLPSGPSTRPQELFETRARRVRPRRDAGPLAHPTPPHPRHPLTWDTGPGELHLTHLAFRSPGFFNREASCVLSVAHSAISETHQAGRTRESDDDDGDLVPRRDQPSHSDELTKQGRFVALNRMARPGPRKSGNRAQRTRDSPVPPPHRCAPSPSWTGASPGAGADRAGAGGGARDRSGGPSGGQLQPV